MTVIVRAVSHEPAPAAIPTAAVAHRLAAVVRPRIVAEVEVRARDLASGAALTAAVADVAGIEIAESSSQDE